MNHSTPGLPVHHQLPEFTQTHVHRVSDAIQPSHPLSSPSPPAFNLSQHQGLFQWVNSLHEVAKVLEYKRCLLRAKNQVAFDHTAPLRFQCPDPYMQLKKKCSDWSIEHFSPRCESWTIRKAESWRLMLSNWVLEKTLESPLDYNPKLYKPVNPKVNQSWIFTGKTDAEAEAPILWPPDEKNWLIGTDPDAGKDWRQEEKGTTEDKMVGWHHWLNEHGFEQLWETVKDRETRRDTVHGVTKSRTWLKKKILVCSKANKLSRRRHGTSMKQLKSGMIVKQLFLLHSIYPHPPPFLDVIDSHINSHIETDWCHFWGLYRAPVP